MDVVMMPMVCVVVRHIVKLVMQYKSHEDPHRMYKKQNLMERKRWRMMMVVNVFSMLSSHTHVNIFYYVSSSLHKRRPKRTLCGKKDT